LWQRRRQGTAGGEKKGKRPQGRRGERTTELPTKIGWTSKAMRWLPEEKENNERGQNRSVTRWRNGGGKQKRDWDEKNIGARSTRGSRGRPDEELSHIRGKRTQMGMLGKNINT